MNKNDENINVYLRMRPLNEAEQEDEDRYKKSWLVTESSVTLQNNVALSTPGQVVNSSSAISPSNHNSRGTFDLRRSSTGLSCVNPTAHSLTGKVYNFNKCYDDKTENRTVYT